MSAAAVEFHVDEEHGIGNGPHLFAFRCPRSGLRCGLLVIAGRTTLKRDGNNCNSGVAQWDWDGDVERPTFNPSINCTRCWHGFIKAGQCVDTAGRDEPEPNRIQ